MAQETSLDGDIRNFFVMEGFSSQAQDKQRRFSERHRKSFCCWRGPSLNRVKKLVLTFFVFRSNPGESRLRIRFLAGAPTARQRRDARSFYHGSRATPTQAIIGSDMDEIALFDEICMLLRAAGLEIRTEHFALAPESAGGLCRVEGKDLVLLHAGASKAERARALLEVVEQVGLRRLGIRGAELSPTLLSRLNRRGQMPWPHKSEAPPVAKTQSWYRLQKHLKLIMTPPPLSNLTTLGVGGPPTRFETATTEAHLAELVREAKATDSPIHVLGGGSNIVVADEGVSGTAIKIALTGISVKTKGGHVLVTAAAGENWHEFAKSMTELDYAGIECLGGIPGSVGATPIQNVGAYGQEVSQTIHSVRVLNRKTLKIREFKNANCHFGYRTSVFKTEARDAYIVLAVTFRLTPKGAPCLRYTELQKCLGLEATLQTTFEQVIELRRQKSMIYDVQDPNHRSCGSFFVNAQISKDQLSQIAIQLNTTVPHFLVGDDLVKVPSAWLIERAGFSRGERIGNVGLSSQHALCIVAHEGATATEVIQFATSIQKNVLKTFGVQLSPEPDFWGFPESDAGLPRLFSRF